MESDIMTVKEFLFDLPLYQSVPRSDCEDILNFLVQKFDRRIEVDGYNPNKQCDSTFSLFRGIEFEDIACAADRVQYTIFNTYEVVLRCKRYGTLLHYLIHAEYDGKAYKHDNILSISKVGQYPSVADFHIGQVHKYNKVLPKDKLRELTKAIGLAANGVGIGSFVYLRRIFEHLVFEALEVAKGRDEKFDVNAFNAAKMDKKIQMLSGILPDFLVENHTIYGILSKGIHELSEEDCKKYFSILRESIEMILDEKLEAYQKDLRKKSIKQTLSQIAGEIKK
ncbi:MAG TPA: hypothetical protein PKZ47_04385 [Alistipes sp.]|uniref:hypothetical protein n=1 Tax=unclassified Alistipes TaxID=2608932 RepID=UPI0025869E05|nr:MULTISPECIES: hypothetical protein [unclassified Alistipes]HUN14252.1 hypothetical protein [Alistipes sp.]